MAWNGTENEFGIDLGTCNTLIYQHGKGIVLNEPSVVAMDTRHGQITAAGNEAYAMLGRTPEWIEIVYPLQNGVVADLDLTQKMLQRFMRKIRGVRRFLSKPKVVISIPCGVTRMNIRTVEQLFPEKGSKTDTIEEPIAAAIGAGLPFHEPIGSMMIDLGGGTLQIAVMSMGGIVTSQTVREGGLELDLDIIEYVKREYNLSIGSRTAEQVKHKLGTALYPGEEEVMDVRGRGLIDGLPQTIQVTSSEIYHIINPFIVGWVQTIRSTLESCPPELAGDIIVQGAILSGGGALLRGLPKRLQQETNIPYHLPEHPLECVVLGAGQTVAQLYKRSFLSHSSSIIHSKSSKDVTSQNDKSTPDLIQADQASSERRALLSLDGENQPG